MRPIWPKGWGSLPTALSTTLLFTTERSGGSSLPERSVVVETQFEGHKPLAVPPSGLRCAGCDGARQSGDCVFLTNIFVKGWGALPTACASQTALTAMGRGGGAEGRTQRARWSLMGPYGAWNAASTLPPKAASANASFICASSAPGGCCAAGAAAPGRE